MKRNVLLDFSLTLLLAIASVPLSAQSSAPAASAPGGAVNAALANGGLANGSAVKQLGSIRKIVGDALSLVTDQGNALEVKVPPAARLLRLAPGQTDLKSAAPIQLTDLQVGDRVLVRGSLAKDGAALEATAVIVMKQQDIAQQKQQELLDWQKRSVGGLVQQVNRSADSITLSVSGTAGNKTVLVSTTPKTTFKRYAPDSVKWEDATKATLDDILPGDQLRAKGNKTPDATPNATQVVGEEIVFGTFRNIAGLIISIDSAQSTLTVQDLAAKKPITVKITADSQMKKLSSQMAQGLAMRMRSTTPPAASAASKLGNPPTEGAGARPHGGDLNQMLARLPTAALGDLQKGEAVMIVSTPGSITQPPVAITLLGGVEAILTASPTGKGAETFLTPWSLASAPAGDQ